MPWKAIAGAAVQWLRDNLNIISSSEEVESLALNVEDNGDVYFVPAFSGLFSPHWDSSARGILVGLSRFSDKNHIARAVLESVAYQSYELLESMESDLGIKLTEIRVDGGMVTNNLLMQFQADMIQQTIDRPLNIESTALGAGMLAGLGSGFWENSGEFQNVRKTDRIFLAEMTPTKNPVSFSHIL